MAPNRIIKRAEVQDAPEIALMVGQLLSEIMRVTGVQAFHFDWEETTERLKDFLHHEKIFVFAARAKSGEAVGFVALYEGHALYAEGAFGVISELYVRPAYRARRVGFHLVSRARSFGMSRHWTRLEVTTPPLPAFDRTLAFYQREGFVLTGGRKLKVSL